MTPSLPPSDDLAKQAAARFRELILRSRPQNVSSVPDGGYLEETLDLDSQKKKTEIANAQQNIDERKKYAHRTFCLVCCWLAAIAGMIVLQGFNLFGFWLDSGIVIAMIGGTTTGVVGIFLIVARYLFPKTVSTD